MTDVPARSEPLDRAAHAEGSAAPLGPSPGTTASAVPLSRGTTGLEARRRGVLVIGQRTVVAVALLVALELALHHLGGFGWWTATVQSERYGWRMLPDQTGWSRDLRVPEHINSHGYRDREWEPPVVVGERSVTVAEGDLERTVELPVFGKDETLFRIAVVGNSMTYGTSVPVEETWPRVLEARVAEHLAARGDPRAVLVMNFAVQGYVYEQMARVWADHARPFRPDLFILPTHPHDVMPMAPAQDDAEYDFRDVILRTATFDMLSKHVINRWIPRVPLAPEARLRQRFFSQLDASIGDRPFARDKTPYWTHMTLGRPEGAELPPVDDTPRELLELSVTAPAMQGIVAPSPDGPPGILQDVVAGGGELVLLSLPRWRRAFEPGLLGTELRWAPLAARTDGLHHVDPEPAFVEPMANVVADVLASAERRAEPGPDEPAGPYWQVPDMSVRTWIDAEGRRRAGTDIEHADESLFFLDDVGHYSARGHRLIGEEVFRQLRAAGLLDR